MTALQSITEEPHNQLALAIQLNKFLEEMKVKQFISCPIRKSCIPGHTQIDTKILAAQFLGMKSNEFKQFKLFERKRHYRNKSFKVNRKPLRKSHGLKFEGSIFTDGYSVTTLLQSQPTIANKRRLLKATGEQEDEFQYIENVIGPLKNEIEKFVYCDPNRRDLLYCMGHNSRPDERKILRYTSQMRRLQCGHKWLRKDLETSMPQYVGRAEASITVSSHSNNSHSYQT
jgi:hypothetical protein